MSACLKTPLFPQCTAYTCEHIGECDRRFAAPDDGSQTARGLRELKLEEHNHRLESQQAGGEAEGGVLAIAFGGFQLQVFAAFLEGRFDGPPLGVTLHQLLRLHRGRCRQEVLVAMGSCPIMDVDPTDFDQVLPDAIPGPRASDDLNVSGTAAIPGHGEVGAVERGRHDLLWGSEFLAFHARASHRPARARERRFVQGGIAIKLAHQGEMLAVFAAQSRRLAGPVAAVAHKDEMTRWKPAHQMCQQQPGDVRRGFMPLPMHTIPRRGAGLRRPRRGEPRGVGRTAT